MSWLSDLGHIVVVGIVRQIHGKDAADAAGDAMESAGAWVTGNPPRSGEDD